MKSLDFINLRQPFATQSTKLKVISVTAGGYPTSSGNNERP